MRVSNREWITVGKLCLCLLFVSAGVGIPVFNSSARTKRPDGGALNDGLETTVATSHSTRRATPATQDNAHRIDFARDVLPILKGACHTCHTGETPQGELALDRKDAAFKGGASGPAIVPGQSKQSWIVKHLRGEGGAVRMPPGKPLAEEQIKTIERWIDEGARWTEPDVGKIDFARHVQPIFAASCYECHAGDKPRAQLRLDAKEAALKGGVSGPVIVPGKSGESRLIHRVEGGGDEPRMPLKKAPLTPEQVSLIRRWIDEGAVWPAAGAAGDARIAKHWAFVRPVRPALPAVRDGAWARTPVDRFVFAKLEKENLSPAREAPRETLIRRLSFDLTGLPPTAKETDDFLKDSSPNAYEKVVDRLLGSPRYGERMAFHWLDAARYADTNGYQVDGEREMWRWRDWVIEAFNENMPYDQFVTEQLAGDLLPNATLEQKIATAFNRHHRINAEGGIIAEEYRVEYGVDRVDTSSTVLMGLTVGCARCHNHKYDPVTQKEYYQLYAYFNSIPEDGRAFDQGNSPPWISAPDRAGQQLLRQTSDRIAATERRLKLVTRRLAAQQRRWEKSLTDSRHWFPEDKLFARLPLGGDATPVFNQSSKPYHNGVAKGMGERIEERKPEGKKVADQPEVIGFKDGAPQTVASPAGQGVRFDNRLYFDAGRRGDFRYKSVSVDFRERFTLSAWIRPEAADAGAVVTKMEDKLENDNQRPPRPKGWGILFAGGKLRFQMVRDWDYDDFRAETENHLPVNEWHHVLVVFDGLRQYDDRVQIYVDGQLQKLKVNQRNFYLYWGMPEEPLRVGAGAGTRFRGAIDEVRIYTKALDRDEIAALACADSLARIAAIPVGRRTPGQQLKITNAFLDWAAPAPARELWKELAGLKTKKRELIDSFPVVMVMHELPAPRPAHVLRRGAYDAPAERVKRGVPAVLPPLPANAPDNRLGLARWLTGAEHPLFARVAVNRVWQTLFGTGLVKTSEDFGTQGEAPSHPELLNWLAVEFRQSNWDMKRLLKTIVMSATYRQTSQAVAAKRGRDPENRLLARGPRSRLSAEMIRDQALFVSGLLVEKLGGPSVKPYQPEGLFKDMVFSFDQEYRQDKGEGLWRRSLYTHWKRTVLAPNMQVFDASTREFCRVRADLTNTPLQSLNLMNDVTYVEAARLFAERMLKEGGPTARERLAWAFRAATSRRPSEQELNVLTANLAAQKDHFAGDSGAAAKLLAVGTRRPDSQLDATELASYAVVAGLILNLDEVITKQ